MFRLPEALGIYKLKANVRQDILGALFTPHEDVILLAYHSILTKFVKFPLPIVSDLEIEDALTYRAWNCSPQLEEVLSLRQ